MIATLVPSRAVARGSGDTVLDAIRDPDCALAIHDRGCPPALAAAVAALDLATIDDVGATVPVDDAALHVAALLGAAGYPVATAAVLAGDIAPLVARHAVDTVMLRLEVIETDTCRRFHADMVTTRLIVTYRGAGTQWIDTGAPHAIEQVPTGAVAIFKGRSLVPDPVILHRSPPIAEAGGPRLLLVIDPA